MQPPTPGRGGSFLGTAAAAAAGVIGGSLLLDGIRGMMGSRPGGTALADPAAAAGNDAAKPWGDSGGMSGSDDLARALGRDDLNRTTGQGGEQRQGLFNEAGDSDTGTDSFFDDEPMDDGFDSDFGIDGGDGGGD
jgi:hypothetical protein